jgi:hypothetical protein
MIYLILPGINKAHTRISSFINIHILKEITNACSTNSENYGSVKGVLTNPKTQTLHEFESTLECDF